MTEKDLEIQELRRDLIQAENRCKVYKETVYIFAKDNEKLQLSYEQMRTLNEHLMDISELLAAENKALKAEIEASKG